MTYGQNFVTPSQSASKSSDQLSLFGRFVPGRSTLGEIQHNARLVLYRDGSASLSACAHPIYTDSGFTPAGETDRFSSRKKGEASSENVDRAIRRARAEMRQLVRNNPMPWFMTLTFSPEKIDRYDPREIVRRVGYWCDNAVRRRGLMYAIVPEYHQDGAIHFHGFFNDALEMTDSGHSINGRAVYNCPAWTFGWSTAERVEDHSRALGYALKYVGKQRDKIGGRWWYHGGNMRPPLVLNVDLTPDDVAALGGKPVYIDRLGCEITFLDLDELGMQQLKVLYTGLCVT